MTDTAETHTNPPIDVQSARLIGARPLDSEDSLTVQNRLRERARRMHVDYDAWPTLIRDVALHLFMAGMEEQRLLDDLRRNLARSAASS